MLSTVHRADSSSPTPLQRSLTLTVVKVSFAQEVASSTTQETQQPSTTSPIKVSPIKIQHQEPDQPQAMPSQLQQLAKKYNQPLNLALAIIKCESGSNPQAINHNTNGTTDYSWWQINDTWKSAMAALGWNIKKSDDNLEAGFYILKTYGTNPWLYSAFCWKANLK